MTRENVKENLKTSGLVVALLVGGGGGLYGGDKLDAVLTEMRAQSIANERRDSKLDELERRLLDLEGLHPRIKP